MIDEDFRTALKELTDLPVQKGTIHDNTEPPWVWFQRGEENTDVFNNGSPQLTSTRFDIEVVGLDDDEVQIEAATIKAGMNGQHGVQFQNSFVHGAYVEDHSDSYQYKSFDADEGYHSAAFSVVVIH